MDTYQIKKNEAITIFTISNILYTMCERAGCFPRINKSRQI